MRWGIGAAYETLKRSVAVRNFTRYKTHSVITRYIQHFIYLSNLTEDIILDYEA